MWPFKKKRLGSLTLDSESFDRLILILTELGFTKAAESQDIVGVVDLVSFTYKRDGETVMVTVDSYSGIDVSGSPEVIESVKAGLLSSG